VIVELLDAGEASTRFHLKLIHRQPHPKGRA
jgi:hypothetical protein